MERLSTILQTVQVERNWAVGKYNIRNTPTWSEYVDKIVEQQVKEKHKKLSEETRKFHEKNPDFY